MASTIYMAPGQNYIQKALNGTLNDSTGTITLNNTTNLKIPGYIVIDRVNSSGVATPNLREVVSYTGISGNDLTGCARGADGSTARSHDDTAIVETFPTVGMWNSLATIVSTGFTGDGYLRAINSPVSIAQIFSDFISLPRLAVTSVASVARGEFTDLVVGSTASIGTLKTGSFGVTNLAVTSIASVGKLSVAEHLNAPASITGAFPTSTKVVTATRTLSTANGTVAYTGFGFNPTAIHAMYFVSGGAATNGIGFVDKDKGAYAMEGNQIQPNLIYVTNTSGNAATMDVGAYIPDGFIGVWTKVNSPVSVAELRFLGFK